jgi:hypothetical protein
VGVNKFLLFRGGERRSKLDFLMCERDTGTLHTARPMKQKQNTPARLLGTDRKVEHDPLHQVLRNRPLRSRPVGVRWHFKRGPALHPWLPAVAF